MSLLSAGWSFVRHLLRHHWSLLLGVALGFVLPWILFLEMAEEIWEGNGFPGDQALLRFLHAHATPTLDAAAVGLSRAGGPLGASVLAGAIAVGLLVARQRRTVTFFLLAVGGAQLLNLAAKYLLGRTRPALWAALAPETTPSFPSGHAMAATALAATLGFLLWPTRWRWPALALGMVWALGMGWSRMYLGVHYPSDVLAGWIGSGGCTCSSPAPCGRYGAKRASTGTAPPPTGWPARPGGPPFPRKFRRWRPPIATQATP